MEDGSTTTEIVAYDREVVFDKISEILGVSRSKIFKTDRFKKDYGADSLDMVELVMELEDHFGMKIDDEEIEGSVDWLVREFCDLIKRHCEERVN